MIFGKHIGLGLALILTIAAGSLGSAFAQYNITNPNFTALANNQTSNMTSYPPQGLNGRPNPNVNSTSSTNATTTSQASNSTIATFYGKGDFGHLAILANATDRSVPHSFIGTVVGGNWSINVVNGKVKYFIINLQRVTLGGKLAETYTFNGLRNITAVGASVKNNINGNNTVMLSSYNNTAFNGTTDISTNGTLQFTNVPITVNLVNGLLLNVTINDTKTQNDFPNIPLLGLTTSLNDQNGKSILKLR